MVSDGNYPIAIIEDRYSGVYSGGNWIAVAQASELLGSSNSRVQFCLTSDDGPYGSDSEAAEFWSDPPDWIAVGETPELAIENLRNHARPTPPTERMSFARRGGKKGKETE
jgi:hypothetical protein